MENFILGTLFGITATCFVKKIIEEIRLAEVRDVLEDIDLEKTLNDIDESEDNEYYIKTIVVKKGEEK